MIKLSIRMVVLLVLVIIGLSQLDRAFYKDHFYRDTINQYLSSDKNFDIVFFGNSHSHSSFDPRIFELELGAKSINLGSPAQRVVITEVVADMVLNEEKPDLAVVNIFSLSLNESGNEKYKAFQLETLDFLPLSWSKIKTVCEMFPVSEWPTAFSKTLRNHFNWHDTKNFLRPYAYAGNYDSYKGFVTYKTSFDTTAYAKFEEHFGNRDTEVKSLTPLEKQRIDNIIDQFENNQVPVLFVNAPDYAYDISDNFRTYAVEIRKYLKSKGQETLDFNLIKDSIGLIWNDYRDPNHLNTKGAIKTSTYLADYILKNFKVGKSLSEAKLLNNRYYLAATEFKESLQSKSFGPNDSIVTGVKNIHLYNAGNNKLEFIFEIEPEKFKDLKIATQFSYKKEQPLKKRERSWPTISNKDTVRYANKTFVIVTLYPKKAEIYDLKITINGTGYPLIFEQDHISL